MVGVARSKPSLKLNQVSFWTASLKTPLVNGGVLSYMISMTQVAPARPPSTMTIPAFEAGGSLLALLPKAALRRERHLDIVVVGANTGSKALVAQLKSYSASSATGFKRSRHHVISYDIDLIVQTHSDQDHEQSATALTALLARLQRALQRIAGAASDELVHKLSRDPAT